MSGRLAILTRRLLTILACDDRTGIVSAVTAVVPPLKGRSRKGGSQCREDGESDSRSHYDGCLLWLSDELAFNPIAATSPEAFRVAIDLYIEGLHGASLNFRSATGTVTPRLGRYELAMWSLTFAGRI